MIELMSDAQARVTAMQWHGGQGSELYAFGSSGAIPWDPFGLLGEVHEESIRAAAQTSREALEALGRYIEATPPRDPQPGWSSLWDDAFEKSLR